jgi:hypothetical protein
VRSAVLPSAKQEPGVHAMHAAALPNTNPKLTFCVMLTVPVQPADTHGFGDSAVIVVPAATPGPEMICPTTSRPHATADTETEVPEMLAVTAPMVL